MADLQRIISDLDEELQSLDGLVAGLGTDRWDSPTPAEPWTVRDQISHLAFFDDQAVLAIMNPEAFASSLEQIASNVGEFMSRSVTRGRSMSSAAVLGWWRDSRAAVLQAASELPEGARIPWFGPPMKPPSFVSARLMETWAHGQDCVDALGITRQPTHRLRHVAHIGVLARGYAYVANNMTAPAEPVRVELTAPSGEVWTWNEGGGDSVEGTALDFCLVVTRRRDVADTALLCTGASAREWMSIAQAYAGPPGSGRRPGQFAAGTR
ncbi:MAG: TIGR03084 family metal-binding protein [Actinomycetota bacterium]